MYIYIYGSCMCTNVLPAATMKSRRTAAVDAAAAAESFFPGGRAIVDRVRWDVLRICYKMVIFIAKDSH
jgi:hypothetical protein